jgi:hypothetical protein
MMDFRVTPGPDKVRVLERALRIMGEERGAILISGRSYHYYGARLLESHRWREFMERSILLSPLTDTRYIAHRLLAGMGVLRVTSTQAKPEIPHVVSAL